MRPAIALFESKIAAVAIRENDRRRGRRIGMETEGEDRFYIVFAFLQDYHRLVWNAFTRPTLSVIDRCFSVELEIEKLLIFVHQFLGYDLQYLGRFYAIIFFQLLQKVDKVHNTKEKAQK